MMVGLASPGVGAMSMTDLEMLDLKTLDPTKVDRVKVQLVGQCRATRGMDREVRTNPLVAVLTRWVFKE